MDVSYLYGMGVNNTWEKYTKQFVYYAKSI